MNCQKIAGILDDGDSRSLSAAERRALDAHLAGCAECRAAFAAHESMLAMDIPEMSAELAASCRQLVAAQPIRSRRRVGGRPVLVIGLLLAGAAAAAFVGSSLLGRPEEGAEVTVDAVVAPESPPAADVSTAVLPVDVGTAMTATTEATADATASSGFTVAVSFRQRADNPEAMRATEGVYRALVDELRKIPNIELLEVEASESMSFGQMWWASENVEIRTNALATQETGIVTLPQSGSVVEIESFAESAEADAAAIRIDFDVAHTEAVLLEGTATAIGGISANYYSEAEAGVVNVILDNNVEGRRVELTAARGEARHDSLSTEPLPYDVMLETTGVSQPGGNTWTFAVNARSRSAGGLSTSVGSEIGAVFDPSFFVKRVIGSLQAEIFPVNEALLAATEARVLDRRLPFDEWLLELNRLKQMTARAGNTRLSDVVARAIVDKSLTITDPRQLSAFLRALEGVDDAVLVQPLANALRNGTSEDIRLEAAMLLARFRQDPAARSALEAAASADPSPAVRLNARWAALDEAGHRNLIVTTLLDTRLTDVERIEPLLLDLVWAGIEPVDLGSAIDVTVVNELSEMLRRQENAATRARVLGRLWRESSPALTPLFVQRLNEDESEVVRITVAQALGSRLDEPGVRYALERATASDPISSVREMASHSLDGGNDIHAFETGN